MRQGFRDNAVLVKSRDDRPPDQIAAAESSEGLRTGRSFTREPKLRLLQLPAGETVEAVANRLRATGRYEYVEPDYVQTKDAQPNDPRYLNGDQWSLRNTGQSSGKAGADIHATDAWEIQRNASNVVVALLDSGVRTSHEDLAANLWRNAGETASTSISGVDDDRNGYIDDINGINSIIAINTPGNGNPADDDGHGTATASVVGAVGNNGLGMSGVAWSVQLMSLKFLDASGGGFVSDEIECFDYAIAKGAQIINCSFGGAAFSQSLFDAVKRTRDAGIIVICSAGNDGENNDFGAHYPSGYLLDNILAVANTNRTDDLSASSNYGSGMVEIAAPGTTILVASYSGDRSYTFFSGTSFSAPMVAGALALVKAKFPGETYRETINRVLRSVDPLTGLRGKTNTGGRLNVAAALGTTTARPFNDDFAQRSSLSGETITARGASQASTREANEPVHAGVAGNGSLWWTWVAPRSGSTTISAAGSAFDTLLAVYTGSAITALTQIAANDDESTTLNTSKVTFNAAAGTAYHIAVDRKSGNAGLVVLVVNLLASNDAFDSAQLVAGRSWSVRSDNRAASRETGEPRIRNNTGGHSVWYRWVAPATRRYHIGTYSSEFNTMLGVYTGTSVSALAEVTSSLTGGDSNSLMNSASVTFTATAGTTYYIVVDNEVTTATPTTGSFLLNCMDSEWEFFGIGGPGTVSVAPDGTLHMVDDFGYVYALNSDGSLKWRYLMTGFGTFSAPAVAPDGTVYAGDDSGYLHAVTPTGTRKWRTLTQGIVQSSPAIAADGTIYIRSDGGRLYALNPDTGAIRWSFVVGTSTATSYSSPAIAPDGTIYVAGATSRLYALNPDGTAKWNYPTDFIFASPTIGADGTVYFGVAAPTRRMIALRPDGTLKWDFIAGDTVSSSAAIGADGTVYFGCYDKNLYAVSSTGQLRWTCATGDAIRNTSPAIASDGSIFVGCDDGKVYGVSPDGTLRRTYATSGALRASPLLLNGRLFIPSFDFRLYSVDVGLVSATSPWPMHRQNPRRVGRAVAQTLAIGVQPRAQTVADGASAAFSVGAVGSGTITYQWRFNGVAIAGATGFSFTADGATAANAGPYSVVVTDSSGSITSSAAALTVTPVAPVVTTQPIAQTVTAGDPATLTVFSSGTAPLSYQWLRNGTAISGATSASLTLPLALAADTGSYTVSVTNAVGSTVSQAAVVTVNPSNTGRLVNLSVLTAIANGENFTIGTVVGGAATSGAKPVLIRAIGPTLGAAPFNVPGVLADPKAEVFLSTTSVAANDNWGGTAALVTANAQVGAFPFSDAASKDAAVIYSANATTPPASFTVQIAGNAGSAGLVLAEIYDTTPAPSFTTKTPRLVNVSVLKPIGNGLTVGFVIGGITPAKVLVRAIGPSLGTLFGVPGAIGDPKLELFDGAQKSIATNDNWGGTVALTAGFAQVGAFPLTATSKDAALLATLTPGNYTVQVSPASGDSGLALVEVYEVP